MSNFTVNSQRLLKESGGRVLNFPGISCKNRLMVAIASEKQRNETPAYLQSSDKSILRQGQQVLNGGPL
jgi:hypothetical protein